MREEDQYLVVHSLDCLDGELFTDRSRAMGVAKAHKRLVLQVATLVDYREPCEACANLVSSLDDYGDGGTVLCYSCHLAAPSATQKAEAAACAP